MAFVLSKLLWSFMSPGSLLALTLAIGVVLGMTRFAKLGRALCVLVALCMLALAVMPVGEWALTPLENQFTFAPPDHVDGIIIIGGDENAHISSLRGQMTALDSMRRFLEVDKLAKRYPEAKLVYSGGAAFAHPGLPIQEFTIARDVMKDMGVPTEKMIFEKESRNTYENAVFAASIVHPELQQNWLLVTSAWHMPRAMGCFRKAGWNVYAAPGGYFTTGTYPIHRTVFQFDEQVHLLTLAMHEYVGLVAYWWMGRTSALWPA